MNTAPALVLAYGGAYLVGATCSYALLARLLGGLETGVLARFLVRLVSRPEWRRCWPGWSAAGWPRCGRPAPDGCSALVRLAIVGLVDVGVLVLLARALRINEVTEMVGLLTSRLRR